MRRPLSRRLAGERVGDCAAVRCLLKNDCFSQSTLSRWRGRSARRKHHTAVLISFCLLRGTMDIKSSKRKLGISRSRGANKTALRSRNPKLSELPHRRDQEAMGPSKQALARHRAVLSWLTPGIPASGVPDWAGQDVPWLTVVDDILHAAAAGPSSFDQRSLEWWVNQAVCLVVDAGTKVVLDFYDHLISLVKVHGATVLVVQTVEARRLLWHKYFQGLRAPGADTVVMDVMNDPTRGAPIQLFRMGEMGDDFGPNGPSSPGSLETLVRVI
jgi:hypothetical protein